MYGEEEKAQQLGLTGPALLEHRQRFSRPIANDFDRWLNRGRADVASIRNS
jgi:hypothetical protein